MNRRNGGDKKYNLKAKDKPRENDRYCIYHYRSRSLHNAKYEREPRERSLETRRDMVQVDLWVATVKGTEGGRRKGSKEGPVEEEDRVCVAGQPGGSRSRGPIDDH